MAVRAGDPRAVSDDGDRAGGDHPADPGDEGRHERVAAGPAGAGIPAGDPAGMGGHGGPEEHGEHLPAVSHPGRERGHAGPAENLPAPADGTGRAAHGGVRQ